MRHVPSYIDYIYKAARNTVEELIELTLDQAKARRLPVDDLESYHGDLYRYYNEFNALLQHIGKHHQLTSTLLRPFVLTLSAPFLKPICWAPHHPTQNAATGRVASLRR